MAVDLTVLRSRLLLPADPADIRAAQAQAEALRRQMIGRVEIGAAADWLERQTQLGRHVFARGLPHDALPVTGGRVVDVTALLRACLVALQPPADANALYRVPSKPFWTVADAVASTLLAGLELAREGVLALQQSGTFAAVSVKADAPPAASGSATLLHAEPGRNLGSQPPG